MIEDISEIIPNRLYLTSLKGVIQNKNNFDLIVTIMESPRSFTSQFYYAEDDDDFDITQYFDHFYNLMEENIDKRIVVHCYGGISRSATLILSYLMRIEYKKVLDKKNKKLHIKHTGNIDFIKRLKVKRSIVNPNDGFILSLKNYQLTLQTMYYCDN